MIEIHVKDPNVDTGMVPVTWSVDKSTLDRLAELEVLNPHVLLVTAPVGDRYHLSKETRVLVPLTDGIAYVNFRVDGPHRVYGMIVFRAGGRVSKLNDRYLGRTDGYWDTTVLTADGSAFRDDFHFRYVGDGYDTSLGITQLLRDQRRDPISEPSNGWRAACSQLDVTVPAGVFAKPPPAWEAAWVNHGYSNAPVDKCEYGKRRIWAYSVQPPVMLLSWLLRLTVTLGALLSGFKQVNWEPVRHLLATSIEDVMKSFRTGNYFWPESWEKNVVAYVARCALPVFSPLSLLLVAGWSGLVATDGHFWTVLFLSLMVLVVGIVSVVTAFGLILMALEGMSTVRERLAERKERRPGDYTNPETVGYLTSHAEGGTRRAIAHQGLTTRSVKLVYLATKSAVCKPFAR